MLVRLFVHPYVCMSQHKSRKLHIEFDDFCKKLHLDESKKCSSCSCSNYVKNTKNGHFWGKFGPYLANKLGIGHLFQNDTSE